MRIKKLASCTLLLVYLGTFITPLSAATTQNETLYEFMKNTENITASYKYPSMKLSLNEDGKTKLKANTPIILRNRYTISTKNIVSGNSIMFTVLDDVKDESGLILVKAGTPAMAEITFVEYRGMIGRSGEIVINDFHTTAVDGSYVPLSGSLSSDPDNRRALSIILSIFVCPLFLLMEGDDAELASGMTKTVYTVTDTYIKTESL